MAPKRMLAAQIAMQARRNVPAGKTPRLTGAAVARTASQRPKKATAPKSSPAARSVFLQARHMASKAKPKANSNVYMLPSAAERTKPSSKAGIARPVRIAA